MEQKPCTDDEQHGDDDDDDVENNNNNYKKNNHNNHHKKNKYIFLKLKKNDKDHDSAGTISHSGTACCGGRGALGLSRGLPA